MKLPLEDVRVLDLSRLLPGPYCSLILADLGAEVIKVESPDEGDYLRWLPPRQGHGSGFFHALNRNKLSLAIDLKKPLGRETFLSLVAAGVDVVIESFRPGVMDRLGLGYEDLRAARPEIILCSISGHGQEGPRRRRPGHDLNFIGLAGVLGLCGPSSGAPVIPGVQVADVGGGLMGVIGILTAIHKKKTTGDGSWIDISMTEAALSFLSMQIGARSAMSGPVDRGGGLLLGAVPAYSVYRTKDGGYMTLAAIEERFWKAFCRSVGREDMVGAGMKTGEEGLQAKQELEAVFESRTRDEWVAHFEKYDVCCEPVYEGDELFQDQQHRYRGSFVDCEISEEEVARHVACPVRFVGSQGHAVRPSPALGADTETVLAEAGFDESALQRLRAAGVIA